MNYEKKYKEALERARVLMTNQNPPAFDKHLIEIVFPELKESEDEKIKREIVAYINELADLKNEKIPTKWLAWLEKQGGQKSVFEMKTPEESLGIDSDTYNKIVDECIYGEQKPADEVEPKFKVGDKVTVKGDNTIYTIGIIAPDKTCWLKHGSREYGWATFGILKHYVE